MNLTEQILDLARWAPSGDNSQPWRFEMVSPTHVVVHGHDERDHNVYDKGGRPSQISIGALLETLRLAAGAHGQSVRIARRPDAPDERPLVDVWFDAAPGVAADPLHMAIRERRVQRRPLSTQALSAHAKVALERSVGPGFSVLWYEGWRERMRLTWLAVRSAKIRLTIPEAYAVHSTVIRWGAQFSEDGLPDGALGPGPLTLGTSRWAMASWSRLNMMNRFFGGTLAPQIELDFVPGLLCGAHFAIVAKHKPETVEDHFAIGAAVQRFWLTATAIGLQLQPQYSPLIFAGYAREGAPFTRDPRGRERAVGVAAMSDRIFGAAAERVVFLGRIGHGSAATSRSMRLPLERLRWDGPPSAQAQAPSKSQAQSQAASAASERFENH